MTPPASDDREIPLDSDASADSMGADIHEWETIRTDRCGRQHLVFLPRHSEDLDREAFVIAEESSVVDLVDYR